MFGIDQLSEKADRFQSYFQTSNDLLTSIVFLGIGGFIVLLIMLRISVIVMNRADRKKLAELDEEL